MAVGHALTGWCGGLIVATGVGAPPWVTLTVAGASAGAALLPDLDHPGSTASTAFGPLSRLAHHGIVVVHRLTAAATRAPGDRSRPPSAHRGVTHWWPFPLATGAGVTAVSTATPWAAPVILAVLFTLAIRGLSVPEYRAKPSDSLGRRVSRRTAHGVATLAPPMLLLRRLRRWVNRAGKLGVVVAAVLLVAVATHHGVTTQLGPWLGVLIGAAMYLHIAGDAPTESGIPGITLRGEWRLPRWLAFKAGGWFEVVAVWVPLSLAGTLLVPGVAPAVVAATVALNG